DKDLIKPNSIIIPPIIDKNLLNNYLNIEVITPIKGEKKKLLDMAILNSKIKLEEEMNLIEKDEKRTSLANLELKNILKLDKLDRIEIFDNSNLFGTFNVSGMVVFIDGVKAKDEYRKFKITNNKNDDYNTMREVIARRYTKVLNENLDKPDLIIVDGALGQINVAKEVLKELNLNIKVVGLKKDDKHNTNALVDDIEIPIDKKSNLFHYLTIMQDEVHNFTINYHKQIRSKGALSSILDNIEGIGEKRKNILLKKYKTLNKMKEATILELKEILQNDIAVNLKEFLDNYKI
ncbi:MAG: excinuclease ABC subunit C, partial [Bacilli bacterium]|nr:excinuclease ABC subunit C [Bacilli bacterium]